MCDDQLLRIPLWLLLVGGGITDLGVYGGGGTSIGGEPGWGRDSGEERVNTIYIKLTVQKSEFTHQSNLLIDCQWCVPEYTTQLHYSSKALTEKTVQFAWAF